MVKVGVLLPSRETVMYDNGAGDPRRLVAIAKQAESLGYDSAWIGDSLLAKPRAEPLTTLAAIAAATDSISLGTAVLIASQRNPEQLAQATATVDALSDGRLILGIGAGPGAPNVRADHEFVGANFDRRSSRMIEVMERCRSLWSGADGVQMYPLPPTPNGPPVWIGGEGPKTLERTGRLADGWFPISANVGTFAERLAVVRESAAAAGRNPDDIAIGLYVTVVIGERVAAEAELHEHSELYYNLPHSNISQWQGSTAGTADAVGEWLQEFIDAGAEHLCVRFACRDVEGQLEAFAPLADQLRG